MIIVEGPDGAGKTTLVKRLQEQTGLSLHPRFVGSDGVGDRSEIFRKMQLDTQSMIEMPVQIYDRHPLISEYVYGPACRGKLPVEWTTPQARLLRSLVAERSLVVWCMPSLDTVRANLSAGRDMIGVDENIANIYASYQTIRQFWQGRSFTHDYEHMNATHGLIESFVDIETTYRLDFMREYK